MFNVLPDNFKEEIRKQYRGKRTIVWLSAVIALQISTLIFLMPSYVYLTFQEKNLVAQNDSSGQTQQTQSTAKISQIFKTTNAQLSALSLSVSSSSTSDLIAHLISLKGSSITFQEITYTMDTATSSTIALSGVAATRESLLSLAKTLEADDSFENVDLPVSNFAKDKNIDFSMTMEAHL